MSSWIQECWPDPANNAVNNVNNVNNDFDLFDLFDLFDIIDLLIQYICFFVGYSEVVVVDIKTPPILSIQPNYKVFQAFWLLLDPDPVDFAGEIDVIDRLFDQ